MRRSSGALVAALVWAAPASAWAGERAVALKLFEDGVKLYQRGDWTGARRLFREADAEFHAPAIVYNVGLAEEKLEHPQAAVDAYEAYVGEVGDRGEFTNAAVVAIAQIKARSTRLRIETKPSGARVFVDGAPLTGPAPVNQLVRAGEHVVVAQGEGWREEKTLTSRGAGEAITVVLEAAVMPEAAPIAIERTAAPAVTPALPDHPVTVPRVVSEATEPEGITWGASFGIVPIYLLGVTSPGATNARSGASIVAGPMLELGYALTPSVEFLARGLAGLGPDGKPSYAYMGGPGLLYRLGSLWLGATFLGGQIETKAHGARYGTDLVFGAMLEASVAVIRKQHGEWIAGLTPGFLLTHMQNDNTAFFFPATFGYRAY